MRHATCGKTADIRQPEADAGFGSRDSGLAIGNIGNWQHFHIFTFPPLNFSTFQLLNFTVAVPGVLRAAGRPA